MSIKKLQPSARSAVLTSSLLLALAEFKNYMDR
jgi:hypothetical protein